MAGPAVGDHAPNFDLASTEDVVLMLRDEIPRTAVLLYFFADPGDERARADLEALAARSDDIARAELKVMAISPAKLDALKAVQRELALPFPLLVDDRDFARDYGVRGSEEEPAAPALVLVDRDQTVLWLANPAPPAAGALGEILAKLKKLPSSTANYPRSVINRLVDLWVN